jgi:tRNA(Ile)-lysidine synthase
LWPAAGKGARLGVAVSGGPDSLALLLLAHAALPGRVEAATVDHGLRAESAAEADEVARVCAGLGLPHATLAVTLDPGNVQAEARAARYAALAGWAEERGLGAVATAHHADDQAETLLLRLNRGSGVAGLAGVRAVSRVQGCGLPLLRPLLDWRRAELGEVVAAAGLTAADDPSNRDPRYDRARLRMALADADWLDPVALARSAAHLADADAALEWATAREWRENVAPGALGSFTYKPAAPRAVALRVIALLVEKLDGEAARGSAVARLFDTVLAGQPASIGSLVVRPGPDGWSFMKAPRRRS